MYPPNPTPLHHVSHVMCRMSHIAYQVSHVTCQVSHIHCIFSVGGGQNDGASKWRVCYQRGLPRLVLLQDRVGIPGIPMKVKS